MKQKQPSIQCKLLKNKNSEAKYLIQQEQESLKSHGISCCQDYSKKQLQKISQKNKRSWIALLLLILSLLSIFYIYSSRIFQESQKITKNASSKIEVPLEPDIPELVKYETKTKQQQAQQILKQNLKVNQNINLKQVSTDKERIITTRDQSVAQINNMREQAKQQVRNMATPIQQNKNQSNLAPIANLTNSFKTTNNNVVNPDIVVGITQEQKLLAKNLRQKKLEVDQQKIYQEYETKYNISSYKEIPFCIVVPTYNNVINDRYLHNIESIVGQNYSNYRVLIIDDASMDDTGKRIQQYVNTHHLNDKFSYKKNEKNLNAMPNLRYAAMNFCKSYEIFMVIDGDDQIIGKNVFKLFNANFQKTKSYFVYSNFLSSSGTVGYSGFFKDQIIQQNMYRLAPFMTSHLRGFYTKLFQLIKQEDLKTKEGEYFHAANDLAICVPSLEMSGKRITYLTEITYYYNANTGLNNHMVRLKQQKANDKYIRTKQRYNIVEQLFTDEQIKLGGLDFLTEKVNNDKALLMQRTASTINVETPDQNAFENLQTDT